VQYRDDKKVQDVIRMLGALQLAPSEIWNHALILINQRINDQFDLLGETARKLKELIEYFRYILGLDQQLVTLFIDVCGFLSMNFSRSME